jgi:lysophospholipase L1-like esterase
MSSPPEKPRRRIGLRARLGLLLFSSAFGLAGLEIGARILAHVRTQRVRADWERLRHSTAAPAALGKATLGQMVFLSDDPHIVYELIPNVTATFQGQECAINAEGHRDGPWPAPARTPDSLRIVGIGDSVMFGWGVRAEDSFLSVLQRSLAAALPGTRVEVLNTGVPGYNTAMEVTAFERQALRYRPDVVILDYVGNDTDLPNLIASQSDPFDLGHSFAWDLVRKLFGRWSRWSDSPLQGAPFAGDRFESDPDRVPPAYRDMVGEAGVERAMVRLHDLAQAHAFHVVVTTHLEAPAFVHRICERLGWPLEENTPSVRRYMAAHAIPPTDYLHCELTLPGDPHPSAAGHRLFAATIFAFLQHSGWLPAAAGASGPRRPG